MTNQSSSIVQRVWNYCNILRDWVYPFYLCFLPCGVI